MDYKQFVSRYQWNFNDPKHLLGEGGFGKVYLAYDTTLDRQVALKTSAVSQARESLTLKHEVDLVLTQLPKNHKNIVKYESCHRFQMGFVEYDVAILQYYPKGNLVQLLSRESLTVAQKANLAQQILDGIAFYQAAGIIHRDLKPANILIAETPTGEYVPKIGDFGISKVFEPDAKTRVTNTVKGGTLRFAAPEQLVGDKIGLNADLWSYGVLLYYLFLNELPITVPDASTASYEAQYFAYLKTLKNWQLDSKVNGIPQPFQNWVKQCLVIDTQKRAQSVADLKVWTPAKETLKFYPPFVPAETKPPQNIEIELEKSTELADKPNLPPPMPPFVTHVKPQKKPPTALVVARFEQVSMLVFLVVMPGIFISVILTHEHHMSGVRSFRLQIIAQAVFHLGFFIRNLILKGALAGAKIRYSLVAMLSTILLVLKLNNKLIIIITLFGWIANFLYLKKVNEELSNA